MYLSNIHNLHQAIPSTTRRNLSLRDPKSFQKFRPLQCASLQGNNTCSEGVMAQSSKQPGIIMENLLPLTLPPWTQFRTNPQPQDTTTHHVCLQQTKQNVMSLPRGKGSPGGALERRCSWTQMFSGCLAQSLRKTLAITIAIFLLCSWHSIGVPSNEVCCTEKRYQFSKMQFTITAQIIISQLQLAPPNLSSGLVHNWQFPIIHTLDSIKIQF